METTKTDEGTAEVEEKDLYDDKGNPPETVPWQRYVATKETIGSKLNKEKELRQSLEEQLKTAVKKEDHEALQTQLNEANTRITSLTTELSGVKEATLAEKRAELVKRGYPEDKAKELSAEVINATLETLGAVKPLPDLGDGTGGNTSPSSKGKIKSGFDSLHPQ